jgi:hypothetical protein
MDALLHELSVLMQAVPIVALATRRQQRRS